MDEGPVFLGDVWLLRPGSPTGFPDPRRFDNHGLVAIGGDLSVSRLLEAYRSGVFPWFGDEDPLLWWSPDPRCHITPETLHVSRSLERSVRRSGFRVTLSQDFAGVIRGCSQDRPEGTWLTGEMIDAYTDLALAGHAHSVECWDRQGRLVGGLYGVSVGGLFAAESMFHTATDASKVALVAAVRALFALGVTVFDVQFRTDHLESMGAVEWSRKDYLTAIAAATGEAVDLEPASFHGVLPRVWSVLAEGA